MALARCVLYLVFPCLAIIVILEKKMLLCRNTAFGRKNPGWCKLKGVKKRYVEGDQNRDLTRDRTKRMKSQLYS